MDKSLQTAQGNYKVHLQAYIAELRVQLHKVRPAPQQHMSVARQWEATKAKLIKAEEKEKNLETQLSDLQTKLKEAKKETAALREQAHAQEQLFKQTATQVAGNGGQQLPEFTLEALELEKEVRDAIAPCFDKFMQAMQKFFTHPYGALLHEAAGADTPGTGSGGGEDISMEPDGRGPEPELLSDAEIQELEELLEQAISTKDKRRVISQALQKTDKRFRPY